MICMLVVRGQATNHGPFIIGESQRLTANNICDPLPSRRTPRTVIAAVKRILDLFSCLNLKMRAESGACKVVGHTFIHLLSYTEHLTVFPAVMKRSKQTSFIASCVCHAVDEVLICLNLALIEIVS